MKYQAINCLDKLGFEFEPERYELRAAIAAWLPERRDVLRSLGGLVLCLLKRDSVDAQKPGRGGRRGGGAVPAGWGPGCILKEMAA